MNIKIHRSPEQKSVLVEISTVQTKILIDGGANLEENEVFRRPDLQEQYSFADIKAVFHSHYRTDYVTLLHTSLEKVPVYTGKLAGSITAAAQKYKAAKPHAFTGFYENGVSIKVGNITVTPYLVDDMVYNGYLLLIEGEGKKVIYTGDYRANGRKSFDEMLAKLPKRADVLICEHGVIREEDINLVTERALEELAAEMIGKTKGPVFVLQSATEFDRASTMFQAAKQNKRLFLEDLYMSQLAAAAGEAMPNPAGWIGVKAYLTTGYKDDHFRYKMFTALPRLGKAEIETQSYVMCIRTSMKKYMKSLFQSMNLKKGIIINSLPPEEWNSPATQEFLAFAKEKGLESVTFRNSGHSDAMALRALVDAIKPTKILPMDTRNAKWLIKAYPKIPVVAVDDIKC